MKQTVNQDYFNRKMFFRALPPILISYIGLAIADTADAIVVGQRLGVTGLAAISMALPVFMLINVVMHSYGMGGFIVYARLMGEGKQEKARQNFNGVLWHAMLVGVILAAAGNLFLDPLVMLLGVEETSGTLYEVCSVYVRIIVTAIPVFIFSYVLNYYLCSDGKEKLASIGSTVGNLTDLFLNILLVLVLDGGAAGAALSTVIGNLVAICIYLIGMRRNPGNLVFSLKNVWKFRAWHCFRLGFASSVQYIFSLIFVMSANRLLMKISGDSGVAVFDVIQNVSFLIQYIYDAAAKAAQPLVSTFRGERNYYGERRIFAWNLLSAVILGGFCITLIALFPQSMCVIFGIAGTEAAELGVYALRIYLIGGFLAGINLTLQKYCQACEREKPVFIMAILRGFIFLIPALFFFANLGIRAFWWLFAATETMSLIVFLIFNAIDRKKDSFDQNRVYSTTILGTVGNMTQLADEIEAFCEKWNAEMKQTYFIRMTLKEVCVTIMKHQDQNGYIQITLIADTDGVFELHIRDNAEKFNLLEMDTAKVSEEEYDMDAMGILVIKKRAKEMQYRNYKGFNSLIIKI